jgi:hypothetical protein
MQDEDGNNLFGDNLSTFLEASIEFFEEFV